MTEDKGLTPIDLGGELAIPSDEDFMSMFEGTTGNDHNPLDSLIIYKQGKGSQWMYGPKDEEEELKEATVLVLYSQRPERTWYESAQLGNKPPECFSLDGVEPSPKSAKPQASACEDCPMKEFGADRPCKKRASDFVFQVRDDVNPEAIEPDDLLGEALMRYSIANRESGPAWSSFQRQAKELRRPIQGVIARYGFQKGKSKSGVSYSAIKIDVVGALPMPSEAPWLWEKIKTAVDGLRGGDAMSILDMLSGKAPDATEE